MNADVWSAQDTSPEAIDNALRGLLHERHAANPTLAPARVLNLVVIVDRDWKGEISNRLEAVGRFHASRTVLCAVEERRERLSARAVMTYDDTASGLGVMHEHVEIDLGPRHLERIDTIVDPVLVSELPTMLWSPHGHEDAVHRLDSMIDVKLLDSDDTLEPAHGLAIAAESLDAAYVVDLAWLRTTPWRERLASAFDPEARRGYLDKLSAVSIRHRGSSTASALLLSGWLCSRLGWEPSRLSSRDAGMAGVAARDGEDVELRFSPVRQEAPGLAGVTVECPAGFTLSLDRGQGGLQARQRSSDGDEREWQVLGASRGEGGILGEGVRQALLRDWTYGPALAAARELCPG